MSRIVRELVEDDEVQLSFTLLDRDSGLPIDLTGYTIQGRINYENGTTLEKAMTITSPATQGITVFEFAAGEALAGLHEFEIEATDPLLGPFSYPVSAPILLSVRARLCS